jgi:Flp pilus assembly protein TadD
VWVAAKKPWIGFPLLAYWALHSIESGPISLEMVFEHRMYLPMAMLALAAAVLICGQGRRRKPILAMATVAIALLAGATHARNETWSDLVRLAEDTARKSPLKRRAQADLGVAYLRAGRYEEAEEALLIAIELEPTLAKTRQALGALYLEMGRPEEAAAAFNTANVYDPDEPRIKYAIGEALEAQGQTEEAFAYYIDLGTRYGMEGKPFPAIEPLRRAVRLKPEDSFARNSLGNVYLMAEMLDAALEEYRKAVELAPRNAQAIYNLATTLDRLGEYEEAAGYYRQFVGIAPPDLADYARHASERVQEIESAGL